MRRFWLGVAEVATLTACSDGNPFAPEVLADVRVLLGRMQQRVVDLRNPASSAAEAAVVGAGNSSASSFASSR